MVQCSKDFRSQKNKKRARSFHAHSTDLSITPFALSASVSQRLIIVVLSVRDSVAVRVSAVDANVVTDAITIAIDKLRAAASTASTSTVAEIVADTIAISVYGSWACADIVTYSIAVGIHVLGAASAATLTVLGSSDSCGERDQCNDQDSSHCSYLHFVFTLFEFSPFGQYSISGCAYI